MKTGRMTFAELHRFYRTYLLDHVMPFWERHGIDRVHGGIFTGINDDGTLNTTDKFVWSNARAIYTFSALYNHMGGDPRWLELARNICEFCLAHGRERPGVWGYLLDREGRMLEGEKAIQVDAFAIMGLTEYARACGDRRAVEAALETYRASRERLSRPGSYGTFPYPLPPGAKAHRDYFQFAFAWFGLGVHLKRQDIIDDAVSRANEVMTVFRRPREQVLLEYVGLDGTPLDTPAGRAMVPGHAIESMWFMIHIYRHLGQPERIAQAIETIRWGLEKGWDTECGGLFLGIDVEGREPVYWKNAETKIWWVFAEALYATLLAYEHCGQPWCLDWYWKIHDWAFRHFPDPQHGEWTQRLDRQGSKIDTVIALPVKDPFHLPRALIWCIDVLGRLKQREDH
jgi:N-acylglucosamine 2-epimerase